MDQLAAEVVDRLSAARSLPWLRAIDAAGLDARVEAGPDAESVVAPYRWLLQRIGDGVKPTQAGYLPPVVVTDAMTELGWATDWIGKGNREDLTHSVLDLRESAQRFGLLRKHRGQLVPTKLGRSLAEDPPAGSMSALLTDGGSELAQVSDDGGGAWRADAVTPDVGHHAHRLSDSA